MNSRCVRPPDQVLRWLRYQHQQPKPLPRKPVDFHRRPPYPSRPHKPAKQEEPVTVCIAISCDCYQGPAVIPKFVLIADRMLSTVTSSTQVGIKIRGLATGWYAMFAGNDVSMVENIGNTAASALAKTGAPTSLEVSQEMRKAYQYNRRKQIRDLYLSTYDWEIDYFLQHGRGLLGDADFSSLRYQIDQFDLNCSFLVCGFNNPQSVTPMIFGVSNPGVATPQMLTGYSAIGSGASNALSYLDWRKQSWSTSLWDSLYNGIAAKSLAETALGVGAGTTALIYERGANSARYLTSEEITDIKQMWSLEEANVRPIDLKARIFRILKL